MEGENPEQIEKYKIIIFCPFKKFHGLKLQQKMNNLHVQADENRILIEQCFAANIVLGCLQ